MTALVGQQIQVMVLGKLVEDVHRVKVATKVLGALARESVLTRTQKAGLQGLQVS